MAGITSKAALSEMSNILIAGDFGFFVPDDQGRKEVTESDFGAGTDETVDHSNLRFVLKYRLSQ